MVSDRVFQTLYRDFHDFHDFRGLGETLWVGTSTTSALSLGRVGPAPHTPHLLGPFAAIAQNSSLWSFLIVDSLANRQHSSREELAIPETAV